MVDVAKEQGIAVNTVKHVMLRDAPLRTVKSLSEAKPWETEGISRRTWYRTRGTKMQ